MRQLLCRTLRPVSARAAVYARDWSGDFPDIDGYFEYSEQQMKPKEPRSVDEARELMSDHYKANRSRYPASIPTVRSFIVEGLIEVLAPVEAFEQALVLLGNSPAS